MFSWNGLVSASQVISGARNAESAMRLCNVLMKIRSLRIARLIARVYFAEVVGPHLDWSAGYPGSLPIDAGPPSFRMPHDKYFRMGTRTVTGVVRSPRYSRPRGSPPPSMPRNRSYPDMQRYPLSIRATTGRKRKGGGLPETAVKGAETPIFIVTGLVELGN